MTQGELLPSAFTVPIAAKILKTTPRLLAELTAAGGLFAMPGERRRRYSREEIERVLGRPIALIEYLEADREHDARREANRRYNRKRFTQRVKLAARAGIKLRRLAGGAA